MNRYRNRPIGFYTPHLSHYTLYQLCHVDRRFCKLLSTESRESQQIINELPHPLRIAPNDIQQPSPFRIEFIGVVFQQYAREPVNGSESLSEKSSWVV